jgi:hypothetical protein
MDKTKTCCVLRAWDLGGVSAFQVEKILIFFWLGLVILGLAIFELFEIIWYAFVLDSGSWLS